MATTDVRRLGCPQCDPVPRILATPDLNGDGTEEIVLTMEGFGLNGQAINVPTRMTIVTASGAPYRGVGRLPSRVHAREGIVADFNNDGVDDLFVAAHGLDTNPFPGEQNVLLLSRGAGRHADVSLTHLPRLDDMAHGADAGDIDGDGDTDIVVITNAGGGAARADNYVLLNDGTGRFTFSAGRNHMPASAARVDSALTARLVDVNRDGAPDLVVQSLNPVWERQPGDMPAQIGLNDGTGRFLPVSPRWLEPTNGFSARQLLPLRIGGRTALVGHSLFGQETGNGFRTFGQRLTVYR